MSKRVAVAHSSLIALVLALASTAIASAAPITEYSSGLAAEAAPDGISTGPDGNLWFTERGAGKSVVKVTPSGTIAYAKAVSSAPLQITTGPNDKLLWFTETGTNGGIGSIDPTTQAVSEYALPSGSYPDGIVSGSEGGLWFTEAGNPARIARISAAAPHTITEFTGLAAAGEPEGITVGPEGDLWFTESGGSGAIGRLDPSTKAVTEYTTGLTPDSHPHGITTGPEGEIWFTETVNPGRIGRIDPASGSITEYSSGLTVGDPVDIVAGSDGNLYFTESNGAGALAQITPSGVITQYTEGLTPDSKPFGIAAGPEGNIWFTEAADPARIGRLTLAPSVSAPSAEAEGESTATVTGSVDARSQATSYFFEYGLTTSYGSRTATTAAGSGTTALSVSAMLSGLTPASVYHFRLVASNATGTSYSADASFTTATPTTTTTTQAAAMSLAAPLASNVEALLAQPVTAPAVSPVIGRSAGVVPVSGTILIEQPGGSFAPISADATIPVGSVLDTSHGVLRLVTALAGGKSQSAIVWGGVFQVGQSAKGDGMTNLIVRGAPLSCRVRRHAHAHAGAFAATASKKRALWSQDEHGRYSTYGANSVATVMGTRWETVESCAGTLTRVLLGRVRVRNLHSGVTHVVTAGHSYLARR